MNGHKDVAELLLAHNADLEAKAQNGETPLDWAVDNGHMEMVEFLLAKGADINAKANDGSTPLHLAEAHHNYDVATLLRQHGGQEPAGSVVTAAPLGTGDASTDPTSLQTAARDGNLEKVKSLLQGDPTLLSRKFDCDMTPLLSAAGSGHKDVVEFLLANHADVDAQDFTGETALAHAAQQGNEEMAELLLDNKADINARDKNGETPLYASFFMWHKDMAELLLAHGADPNIADANGKTPLHLAAGWIRPDQAELLLAHKADVNARDKNGDTPLYVAISEGARDDIAQVLLAHGADASIKGHDGQTPSEIAMQKGDMDMAGILGNPAATLGSPPGPADGVTPPELIAQFMTDLAKKPPGPVENDVTEDVIQTMKGMAQLTGTKVSSRESIATGFGIFTLDGPVSEFYAQGLAAIYEGKATLTEAAAKEFQDDYDQSSATWTDKGKTVTDKGPFLMFGPGAADFTDAKVPADRHVVVSFCLVQQHGRWKVHCLYFSNAPLAGDH
jgi:ankyrin repeat protein